MPDLLTLRRKMGQHHAQPHLRKEHGSAPCLTSPPREEVGVDVAPDLLTFGRIRGRRRARLSNFRKRWGLTLDLGTTLDPLRPLLKYFGCIFKGALLGPTNVGHLFICASGYGGFLLLGSGIFDPCTSSTISFVSRTMVGFFLWGRVFATHIS
ncbi:unnamed protein product [Musa textilis]